MLINIPKEEEIIDMYGFIRADQVANCCLEQALNAIVGLTGNYFGFKSVELQENWSGNEGLRVLIIHKLDGESDVINISANSTGASFKDFCRYVANGEKCFGLMKK